MKQLILICIFLFGFTVLTFATTIYQVKHYTNPKDDSPVLIVKEKAKNSDIHEIFGGKTIEIQCAENRTGLFFNPNEYISAYDGTGGYRIGSKKFVNVRWDSTDSYKAALWGSEAIRVLRQLYKAEGSELYVLIEPRFGKSHSLWFDTYGIKQAIDKISRTCNWTP